jgi:hypothetical protein
MIFDRVTSWKSSIRVNLEGRNAAIQSLGKAPLRPVPFAAPPNFDFVPRAERGTGDAVSSMRPDNNGARHMTCLGRNVGTDGPVFVSIAMAKLEGPHRIACLMRKIWLAANDKELAL